VKEAAMAGELLDPADVLRPDRDHTVPEDRLIVWELGVDGWEPICEALGLDVPDKPFPRLHDTNEFRTEFGLEPIPA
jgi:Sulfotransferase domain